MKADGNMYYLYITTNGEWSGQSSSMGGLGDSFYEYLLKMWLITDKKAGGYKRMWDEAIEAVHKRMYVEVKDKGFVFQLNGNSLGKNMEHLTCFSGGMFAMGADKKPEYLEVGAKIARTCYEMYKLSPMGLSPESASLVNDQTGQIAPATTYYILRPEAVETFFYMWRLTKDQKYRDWAWEVFQAIEKFCRVETGGYTGLRDVMRSSADQNQDDLMQTFLLGETFKYLYLIFSDDSVVALDKYVFNTEAHPFPVFKDVKSWDKSFTDLFPEP